MNRAINNKNGFFPDGDISGQDTSESIYGESRRTFIRRMAFGAVGAGSALLKPFPGKEVSCSAVSRLRKLPVIDTHAHCFAGPDSKRFPYHEMATYKPEITATPGHLINCMNGSGVDYAVVVHPEPYQDDHRYLEYCLDAGKGRLKGTILVFCDRPGSMDQLPRLAKRKDIIAARIHAYLPDRLPPFGRPELRHLWKLAGDNGLALQLNFEPRYAAGFEPLIKEFRDVPVIIDHLGHPLQAGSVQEYSIVERWGKLPNTIMKLSNLGAIHDHPDPVLKPVVTRMMAAYGPDRMIWGGEFNDKSTPESFRATREYAGKFLSGYSPEDQGKVFGGNAFRLFFRK